MLLSNIYLDGYQNSLFFQHWLLFTAKLGSEIKKDLILLTKMIEAGAIRGVVDRTYPLEQTADAHRYVETERKKGNVVIVI